MKKIILVISITLLLFGFVFAFLQIRTVDVEGGKIYSDQEIIQQAMSDRLAYHTLYYLVRTKLAGVPCLPFTQEIDVEWVSPVKIILHVYDKAISGCVKYMGQYIFFDKDGIVLQSLPEPMEGVPVVTGVKFGKFTLNEAFEVEDDSLFDTIMKLSGLISHYKVKVDRLDIQDQDVTLYSDQVVVHLGKKSFYDDDLAVLASVLKKTRKKGIAGTIDMQHFRPGSRISLIPSEPASEAAVSTEPEASITPEKSTEQEESEQEKSTEQEESEQEESTEQEE